MEIPMRHLLTFAALLSLTLVVARAGASEPSSPVPGPEAGEAAVHDLVRLVTSEAGFEDAREQAALAWTVARRADRLRERRGMTFRETMRTIADRALVDPVTNRQTWVHRLELDGSRPRGWETLTSARWDARTDAVKATIERMRAFVDGRLPDPCNGPSELWGSRTHPVDAAALRHNLERGIWVEVDCGLEETRHDNVFVRWGSRAERAEAERRLRFRSRRAQQRHRVEFVD